MESELQRLQPPAYFATPLAACLIWRLEDAPRAVVSARERASLPEDAVDVRRREWLAGRAAAKELLRLRYQLEPASVEVLPAESGAPTVHVDGEERPEVHLSLTHTREYVAAACSSAPVGVDVTDLVDAPRIDRIQGRVFEADEAAKIGAFESDERRCAVWAVKEAALKATGGGVFQPGGRSIHIRSLVPIELANPKTQASLYRLPLAVLALVVTAG